MAGCEHLHVLVDSLPEGALQSAETYLKAIQIWPPPKPDYPPEIQQRVKKLEAMRDKFLSGPTSGTMASDASYASFGTNDINWQTGEYTVKTFRVQRGFPMEITERFRMRDNDETLEYDFHITGLGNQHSFVLQFKAKDE